MENCASRTIDKGRATRSKERTGHGVGLTQATAASIANGDGAIVFLLAACIISIAIPEMAQGGLMG